MAHDPIDIAIRFLGAILFLSWLISVVAYRRGWVSYHRLHRLNLDAFPGIYDRDKSFEAIGRDIFGDRFDEPDSDSAGASSRETRGRSA
ncbi:hypothetical protein AB0876_32160 [Mycobacterium sp. NPDC049093]